MKISGVGAFGSPPASHAPNDKSVDMPKSANKFAIGDKYEASKAHFPDNFLYEALKATKDEPYDMANAIGVKAVDLSKNVSNIVVKTAIPLDGNAIIRFRDTTANGWVETALTQDTLEKLQTAFGEDNFEQNGATYTLKNNAELYISSFWEYAKSSYNILSSDKDKNGFLDKGELGTLNTGLISTENGLKIVSAAEMSIAIGKDITQPYMEYLTKGQPDKTKISIDATFESAILDDANFDGIISQSEMNALPTIHVDKDGNLSIGFVDENTKIEEDEDEKKKKYAKRYGTTKQKIDEMATKVSTIRGASPLSILLKDMGEIAKMAKANKNENIPQ